MFKKIALLLLILSTPFILRADDRGYVFVVNFGFVSQFHNDKSCEKLQDTVSNCSNRKVVKMSRKKARCLFLKECKFCKYRH